jgi:polygalacturonase
MRPLLLLFLGGLPWMPPSSSSSSSSSWPPPPLDESSHLQLPASPSAAAAVATAATAAFKPDDGDDDDGDDDYGELQQHKGTAPAATTLLQHLSAAAAAKSWTTAPPASAVLSAESNEGAVFSVRTFGAVGDGRTVDSVAIRKAFATCAAAGGGTVLFPAHFRYLTGPFNISSDTTVVIEGNATILGNPDKEDWPIILPLPWMGGGSDYYGDYGRPDHMSLVHSHGASNIVITGGGTINGQGDVPDPATNTTWVDCMRTAGASASLCHNVSRPHLFVLYMGKNMTISNITIEDSPNWTLHIANFSGVHIHNIQIFNPGGFNRDGIDIDCSQHVVVENSLVDAGDDALCVKAGANWVGRHTAVKSENIIFRNIIVGTGHGITIGSDMSAGVRNVTFENISMDGTGCGIRMKTERGRGGIVEDITYRDITMKNIASEAVQMTLNYHAGIKPTNKTATPIFRNLLIENVWADGVGYAGLYDGLPEQHVINMTLRNVTVLRAKKQWFKCDYVDGKCEGGTNPCPPCFSGSHPPPQPPPPPPAPLKTCKLTKVQGCFNNSIKVLSFSSNAVHDHVTQGNCAAVCNEQQGLTVAGIDTGNHCRCGTPAELVLAKGRLLPAAVCDAPAWPCTGVCCGPSAPASCKAGKCTGKSAEHCGNKGALMAYTFSCAPKAKERAGASYNEQGFVTLSLKTDDSAGVGQDMSPAVMNATDLRMPTLVNFNLKKPITDAQGIAACSAYCTKHSSTCGGWVYVSPAYLPHSKYTGPRCSIKGKGTCYTTPGRPGLFSGALSGPCTAPPPHPPRPPPPLPPGPTKRVDPYYTHFHVQALRHATADPDGPAFFNSSSDPEGTYHIFAQYNPTAPRSAHSLGVRAYSAMQWYHWTSPDLLRWQHQPIALAPGAKQDCGGIWSGSMTLVRNESTGVVVPMITYSVPCQTQINYAVAANPQNPNLTKWTQVGTLATMPEVVRNSSRKMMVDPVPSWRGTDGTWRMIAACNSLRACMWKAPTAMGPFTFVGGFGNTQANMTEVPCFECPDFWRLPGTDTYVLSTMGRGWAVGSYLPNSNDSMPDVFSPLHGKNIPQVDQSYDYGSPGSSAQRSFYDAKHNRYEYGSLVTRSGPPTARRAAQHTHHRGSTCVDCCKTGKCSGVRRVASCALAPTGKG